jgi:hypothetical protein
MDRLDDLIEIGALQVDRGHLEVAVSELALDDIERDAFARKFDRAWRS